MVRPESALDIHPQGPLTVRFVVAAHFEARFSFSSFIALFIEKSVVVHLPHGIQGGSA